MPAAPESSAERDPAQPVARWTAVLDALEQRLVAQEAILARAHDGRALDPEELAAVVAYMAPPGLPPLPGVLAGRADGLLARTHIVQDGLANLIETTRPARSARRRLGGPGGRSACDLDVRA